MKSKYICKQDIYIQTPKKCFSLAKSHTLEMFFISVYICIKVKSCHARWLFKKHDYKKLLESMEDNMFSARK